MKKRLYSKAKRFSVAWYLVDRAFGGHEEGGWYYDCGYPRRPERIYGTTNRLTIPTYVSKTRWFKSKYQACLYRKKIVKRYQDIANQGRHPISSVLSDGEYRVFVEKGKPVHFPTERPYYC